MDTIGCGVNSIEKNCQREKKQLGCHKTFFLNHDRRGRDEGLSQLELADSGHFRCSRKIPKHSE
jgi:hypothetical protein